MVGHSEFTAIQDSRTRIAKLRREIDLLHIQNHAHAHVAKNFEGADESGKLEAEMRNLRIQENLALVKVKKHEIKMDELRIQNTLNGRHRSHGSLTPDGVSTTD